MEQTVLGGMSGLTIGEVLGWIIALATVTVTIGKAVDWIASKRKKLPCAEHAKMLETDKRKIDTLEEMVRQQSAANSVIFRSLFALTNHEITGNSVDKLRESRDELNDYLLKRK